jgi:hypothetical protein
MKFDFLASELNSPAARGVFAIGPVRVAVLLRKKLFYEFAKKGDERIFLVEGFSNSQQFPVILRKAIR